jgi:hypothetical protein
VILLLKSSATNNGDKKMPLHENLVLILKQRVKDAEDDEGRARAERNLAKVRAGAE